MFERLLVRTYSWARDRTFGVGISTTSLSTPVESYVGRAGVAIGEIYGRRPHSEVRTMHRNEGLLIGFGWDSSAPRDK
jgi:hypothetical protein